MTQTAGDYNTLTGLIASDTAANTDYVIQITSSFQFNSGGQVSISNLAAGSTLTIEGQNSTNYTLTGNGNRLFDIAKGQTLSFQNLTLTGGTVSGSAAKGGAVYNSGTLSMQSVLVQGNEVVGLNAQGGGLYVNGGSVNVSKGGISGIASGSAGAAGAAGGNAQGGGIYAQNAVITLTNPEVAGFLNGGNGGNGSAGVNQFAGGAGGNAQGGAIYALNTALTVSGGLVLGDAMPGNGGNGAAGTSQHLSGGAGGVSGIGQGGGIYIQGGSLLITNAATVEACQVGSNESGGKGGAGYKLNGLSGPGGTGGKGNVSEGGDVFASNAQVTVEGGAQIIEGSLHGAFGGDGGTGGKSDAGGQGGDAGFAAGGGLYVANGNVTLGSDAEIDFNSLTLGWGGYGGNGGSGGNGGGGGTDATSEGGGLYVANGSVTVASGAEINGNSIAQGRGGNGGDGGVGGTGGNGGTADFAAGGGLYVSNAGVGGVTVASGAQINGNSIEGGASRGAGGNGGKGRIGGNGGDGGTAEGGGIYALNSSITLNNGTGVLVVSSPATPGINGNSALAGSGGIGGIGTTGAGGNGGAGGLAQGGGVFVSGSELDVTLGNSSQGATLDGNKVLGGQGGQGSHGAGSNGVGGKGALGAGGGLVVVGDKLTLTNATLSDNTAEGGEGGDGASTGHGIISDFGNGGDAQGGGLFVSHSSSALVLNSTIGDNFTVGTVGGSGSFAKSGTAKYGVGGSAQGGGIYADYSTVNVLNSTFDDNVLNGAYGAPVTSTTGVHVSGGGTAQGGGLYAANGTLSLTNDTVAWNFLVTYTTNSNRTNLMLPGGAVRGTGGGIYNGPANTLNLENTIAGLNMIFSDLAHGETNAYGTYNDLPANAAALSDDNLIGDGSNDAKWAPAIGAQPTGSQQLFAVPVTTNSFGNSTLSGQVPGIYGGLTCTLPLAGISPAIGAGDPAAAATIASDEGFTDATDQRGLPRLLNGAIDIGATEMQVALTGSPSVKTVQAGDTIAYTVTVTNGEGVPICPTLTDAIPTNTSYVSGSASGAGWTITEPSTPNNNTLTATMPALNPGATAFLTFSVTVNSGASGTIEDTADLSWSGTNTSGSLSVPMNSTVTGGISTTTTTLNSSGSPSEYGQSVTFTATVSANSPGAGTPTGTVTFYDGTNELGTGTLQGGGATFTTSLLTVGSHSITAVYGGDPNDRGSTTQSALSQVVSQDSTTTALTGSTSSSVFGQSVSFKATVSANSPGAGTPTGTVTFYDGNTELGTASLQNGGATFATSSLSVGSHSITAVYGGDPIDQGSTTQNALNQTVNPAQTTTGLTSSVSTSPLGQNVTFTATVGVVSPGAGTLTGSVEFVDMTTGYVLGAVALSPSGTASLSVPSMVTGKNIIEASYIDHSGDFLGSTSSALTQTVTQSVIVLDSSDAGALKLSGNAGIYIPGNVIVDSSSKSALNESGNANIKAASIRVVGGVSISSNATLSPAAVTGIASVANPLAYLPGPSTSGLTNYGAATYNNGSHILNPGIYSTIQASGTASLTLNPGTYIIEGGGMTVNGNASISGSGVMIYNTGSNYPSTGSYGGITLGGNGTFALTAPTSGPYAGIVLFQPSADTRAISLSGNAAAGLTGTIYAPAALVYVSGNASINGALVVNQLSLSGNASSTETAAGTDAENADGSAGQLLAGDVEVYVNNSNGDLTADELARIQDAVNAVNAVTSPYGVAVAEVSNPTQANVTLSMDTTSASGNYGQGVLGSYTLSGQITLIQGWKWYAGADPSQIGADQYDFETTVTHELGHALGLGHSSNPASAMYATLAPATAIHTLTAADLNIPYAEAGADAQEAAPPSINPSAGAVSVNGALSEQGLPALANTNVPSTSASLSFVGDQLIADLSLLLSNLRIAATSQFSSVSASWQPADALALQCLDTLLSLEAGAMGIATDVLPDALLLAGKSSLSGA